MKVGLISDIHADLDGLIAALELLKEQGCNDILCAGDLVGKGPDGDAVVRVIRLRHIPTVMGNHDLAADYMQELLRKRADDSHPLLLRPETLLWLKTRPFTYQQRTGRTAIFMIHGAPGDPFQYLYWDDPLEDFYDCFSKTDAGVIVVGHTHAPMHIRCGDRHILNPGSVCGGEWSNGSHTCAVLTLPGCDFEVFDVTTGRPAPFDLREIEPEES